MKKQSILGTTLCMGLVAACSSSSSTGSTLDSGKDDVVTKTDAGHPKPDGSTTKDAAKAETAPPPGDTGADAGPVRHVLVTYEGTSPTTMLAVNLTTATVDGTLTSTDTEAITDTSNASAPFLLNQTIDLVDRIDPSTWTVASSYSVALPVDGGGGGSDAIAVVVAEPTQAYVLRYLSNVIDVIDPTKPADAGMSGSIDLTSLVQATDEDGLVEVTAGAYVSASKLLYVVLGNIDRYTPTSSDDYDLLCGATRSTVIAIDTKTNAIQSLGGTALGGGIALAGYDPTSAIYDAANARILLFEAGCNPAPTADGGAPGAVKLRGVEAVDLTAKTSKVLVDTSDKGFPASFVYISEHQAVLGFSYPTAAYNWDPTLSTLASQLHGAPDLFDYDGHQNLVGARVNDSDAGVATSTDIVSMSLSSGNVTTLVANAIPIGSGFLSSVGVWPRP